MACVAAVDEVMIQVLTELPVCLYASNQFLCRSDGEGGVRRNHLGGVGYRLIEKCSIDNLSRQSNGESFWSFNQAGGENDLFQKSWPDQVQKPGAVGGRQTITQCASDRHAEPSIRTTDSKIAGYGDYAASSDGSALNPSNSRFGHPFQSIDDSLEPFFVRDGILGGTQIFKLTDVGAGYEGSVAGAAQNKDAYVWIGINCLAGVYKSVIHSPGHGVSGLRAIEGKHRDRAIRGVSGIGCGHVVALLDQ